MTTSFLRCGASVYGVRAISGRFEVQRRGIQQLRRKEAARRMMVIGNSKRVRGGASSELTEMFCKETGIPSRPSTCYG
jgi:hypothetical protein